MVTHEMLEQQKALANAINNDQVETPNMPVPEFTQEAADLIPEVEHDRSELEAINFDFTKHESLEPAIEVLRDFHTMWNEDKNDAEEARKEWDVEYPKAEELKKETLRTMRFVYEGDQDSLDLVSQITEGSDYRDTIQDLHDIAYKAKLDLSPFEAINYDVSLFDTAEQMSNTLMLLLARMNGEKNQDSENKLMRDKAFTHLKGMVDYIRRCGKYIHRNNPERAAVYTSRYFRR